MVSVNYLLLANALKTLLLSVLSSKILYIGLGSVYYTFAQVDEISRFQGTSIRIDYFKAYARDNFTFKCPDANENTLIEYLEWHYESRRQKILEYHKDAGTTLFNGWNGRVGLDPEYGLIFSNVTFADTGYYMCLINHRLLPDVVIRFTVIDVPDPPGRPLITFFTSRSANLSWAPPRGTNRSTITHYTVIVRKHQEKPDFEEETMDKSTNFTIRKVNTTSNESSFQVKGLRPYTVYSFQIIAWNAIGPSNPSKASYFMVTLREVPEARIPFTARNMSSTSVYISWDPPDIDLINGDFLGYRLTWRQMNGPNITQEKYIRNASVTKHIIANLLPHTEYHVGLSVFNPEGYGPNTTLLIITDEGPPSSPTDLTIINATETSLTLRWRKPDKPNGELKGYRIYFTHGNFTDTLSDKNEPEEPVKTYVLDKLEPDTTYSVKVKAFSAKHEGNESAPTVGRTDIMGPSAPFLTNVSCEYNNSIMVEVTRPERYPDTIDMYYIDVYENGLLFDQMALSTDKKYLATSYIFRNVTPGVHYNIQVQAASKSNRTGNLVRGERSKLKEVYITEGCYQPSEPFAELWAGILAGFLCAIGVLLLGGGGYLVWKAFCKSHHRARQYTGCSREGNCHNATQTVACDTQTHFNDMHNIRANHDHAIDIPIVV